MISPVPATREDMDKTPEQLWCLLRVLLSVRHIPLTRVVRGNISVVSPANTEGQITETSQDREHWAGRNTQGTP